MGSISTARKVRGKVRRNAGRRRRAETKTKKRASKHAAYSFLKQTFFGVAQEEVALGEDNQMSDDFYRSLRYVSKLYGFTAKEFLHIPFPQNIHLSFKHAEMQIKQYSSELEVGIISNEKSKACIVVRDEANPGMNLYYIPVEPLAKLHTQRKISAFNLVIGIFSYLNQVAGVPTCTQNDFISYNYEMIEEWLVEARDEYEEEDFNRQMREVHTCRRKTYILDRIMARKQTHKEFAKRIAGYENDPSSNAALLEISKQFMELYVQYPKTNFYKHITYQEDEYGERMYPHHYLSFHWSSKGWISQQEDEMINSHLQECSTCEIPVVEQVFDRPQKKKMTLLNYERRLLELIWDLNSILNNAAA